MPPLRVKGYSPGRIPPASLPAAPPSIISLTCIHAIMQSVDVTPVPKALHSSFRLRLPPGMALHRLVVHGSFHTIHSHRAAPRWVWQWGGLCVHVCVCVGVCGWVGGLHGDYPHTICIPLQRMNAPHVLLCLPTAQQPTLRLSTSAQQDPFSPPPPPHRFSSALAVAAAGPLWTWQRCAASARRC